MTKTKTIYLTLLAVLLSPMAANATVITFNEFGSPGPLDGDEWASFGILVEDVYWYSDSRDPFDGVGLASSPVGVINFITVVSSLAVDWLAVGDQDIYIDVFDSSGGLVDSFFQAGAGTIFGTTNFTGAIASMRFYDSGGSVGISTLDFTAAPVPEPGTLALLGIGLVGMAARRRKKV